MLAMEPQWMIGMKWTRRPRRVDEEIVKLLLHVLDDLGHIIIDFGSKAADVCGHSLNSRVVAWPDGRLDIGAQQLD